MTIARISDIAQFEDKSVRLQGWLYNKRSSKKIHFLQVRDGSGIIQCVAAKGDIGEALFAVASTLQQEASLEIVEFSTKGMDIADTAAYYRDNLGQENASRFLVENIDVLQALVDESGYANHMRFVVRKSGS